MTKLKFASLLGLSLVLPFAQLAAGEIFEQSITYRTPNGTVGNTVGDFNGDGILDIATANRWSHNVSILHGLPDGTFGSRVDVGVGERPDYLASGDFNGDGLDDLAVANWDDHDVAVLIQERNGGLVQSERYAVGLHPHEIIAADFNKDGSSDIAVATNDSITVLTNDAHGAFDIRHDYPIDSVGLGIVSADFNQDEILDLVTTLPNTGMINVLLGKEDGGFEMRRPSVFRPFPALGTSSDFDQDGYPDFAFAGYSHSGSLMVLLNDQAGFLELVHEYSEPRTPLAIVSADFDLDGKIDIATSESSVLWLYRGIGDGSFEDGQAFDIQSDYLSVADLNQDGGMDIIASFGDRGFGGVRILFNTVPEPSSFSLSAVVAALFLSRCEKRGTPKKTSPAYCSS